MWISNCFFGSKYAYAKDEIKEILQQTKIMEGPVLIELKVKVASRDDLGRPTTTPLENKFHFMEFLKNK